MTVTVVVVYLRHRDDDAHGGTDSRRNSQPNRRRIRSHTQHGTIYRESVTVGSRVRNLLVRNGDDGVGDGFVGGVGRRLSGGVCLRMKHELVGGLVVVVVASGVSVVVQVVSLWCDRSGTSFNW